MNSRVGNSRVGFLLVGAACLALLGGCGSDDAKKAAAEDDPALSGALGDQIMVDPDLAGQNQAGSAVSAGPIRVELPPEARGPEAIAAAQQDAVKLLGGKISAAPAPGSTDDVASLVEDTATAAQVAEAARTGAADCAAKVEYSMNWVKALPAPLAVYPRGSVQEAAGTDKDGCRLRVVNFVTPVPTSDVVNFYHARTRSSGYSVRYSLEGKDHVLGGNKPGSAYVIYVRSLDNGLTEVDVVAGGG